MDEMSNLVEQLHQFREMLKQISEEENDPDYNEFISEKEAELSELAISHEAVAEENKSNDIIKPENTWSGLLRQSNTISPPVFTSKRTLGNEILDYALQKSVNQVQFVALPEDEIKDKIFRTLKQNRVAKKSALSTVRFLRDVNGSLFVDCPECDYENEPGWIYCANCGTENSD